MEVRSVTIAIGMIQSRLRGFHELGEDITELWCPPTTAGPLATRGMRLAGWTDAGRGYRIGRLRPDHGQLVICYGGVGRAWVGDEWRECGEGFAYVSPPYAPCGFETVARSRWKFAWIQYAREACDMPGLLRGTASVLTPIDPHPLRNAIEGLYREGVGNADRPLMERWCDLMHSYVLRAVLPDSEGEVDPLRRLWATVDARPADDWSLDRLADLAGMNIETLRVLCQRHVKRSPMQHVAWLRMQRANLLIRSTSMKMSVIARMVGYENPFAFSTAFRRIYGNAPSSRRESQR